MALTPWPSTPAALAAARVTLTAGIGSPDGDFSDGLLDMLGSVASATVEDYAPAAPQALRDSACIRLAGYLYSADFGAVERESIGPRDVSYMRNHGDAFRRSGAAMLLTRWRVRRLGAI